MSVLMVLISDVVLKTGLGLKIYSV